MMLETRHYHGTNFITGMRAWAALAVLLIHAGGGGLRDIAPYFNDLVNLGAKGVLVFFVVAGYSVTASFLKVGQWRAYGVQRLCRLCPPYFLAIFVVYIAWHTTGQLVSSLSWKHEYDVPFDLYNLLMHLSYLSFLDYKIANSILGVEWTLPIEVFFYAFIPLFLWRNTLDVWRLIALFAAAGAVYGVSELLVRYWLTFENKGQAWEWTPFRYPAMFALGTLAYWLRQRWTCPVRLSNILVLIGVLIIPLQAVDMKAVGSSVTVPLATCLILIAGRDDTLVAKTLFNNRIMRYLGTISYSIYLFHPLTLYAVWQITREDKTIILLLTTALTLLVASLTYRYIEHPSIQYGRRLSQRLKC